MGGRGDSAWVRCPSWSLTSGGGSLLFVAFAVRHTAWLGKNCIFTNEEGSS